MGHTASARPRIMNRDCELTGMSAAHDPSVRIGVLAFGQNRHTRTPPRRCAGEGKDDVICSDSSPSLRFAQGGEG